MIYPHPLSDNSHMKSKATPPTSFPSLSRVRIVCFKIKTPETRVFCIKPKPFTLIPINRIYQTYLYNVCEINCVSSKPTDFMAYFIRLLRNIWDSCQTACVGPKQKLESRFLKFRRGEGGNVAPECP